MQERYGCPAPKPPATPSGCLAALIAVSFAGRLLLSSQLGFGVDESYVLAAGRSLRLGYFDHPPVVWWLGWLGQQLGEPGDAWAIRLPFILLFSVSTFLMYRLATDLFDAHAGLWSALLLNVAPVLSVTAGTWVLPDGPLMTALLGFAICLHRASRGAGDGWRWWVATGTCLGLAALSKYTAAPVAIGAVFFLLSDRDARRWLARPQPYVATVVAGTIFSPVIGWNAQHGWVSFLFQGARIESGRWHPLGPLTTLAGEALFFLPWIWLPLAVCMVRATLRGPRDRRRWLLACLSVPTVALFEIASIRAHVMFHWAAPATMLALPLLGNAISTAYRFHRPIRIAAVGTATLVLIGATLVGSEIRFNWLPLVIEDFPFGQDPDLAAVDWTSLEGSLGERDLLQPGTVIGATRWFDAGKIDFALRGAVTVICLGSDPREYGLIRPAARYVGRDILIISRRATLGEADDWLERSFERVDRLEPATVLHAGRPALRLHLFVGHGYAG